MSKGIGVVGLYVHDQDEALDFYVNKLGLWSTQTHATAPIAAHGEAPEPTDDRVGPLPTARTGDGRRHRADHARDGGQGRDAAVGAGR